MGKLKKDESIDVLIQFEMVSENRWQINSIEENGEEQDVEYFEVFINAMCYAKKNL